MSPSCQEKNATGLTMVAVGVNKAAEQYLILDDQTREDLATGKYRDQRRGSFGTLPPSGTSVPASTNVSSGTQVPPAPQEPSPSPRSRSTAAQRAPHRPARSGARPVPGSRPATARRSWSWKQQKLALLYNEQGLRPEEIARKIGVSPYQVTQIILTSRNRGKL